MNAAPPRPTLFPYTTLFRSPEPGTAEAARSFVPCNEPLGPAARSEEHTSELQSLRHLVCRLLLGKKSKYYATSRNRRRNPGSRHDETYRTRKTSSLCIAR